MTDHAEVAKTVTDVFAASITLGAIVNILPSIATILTIIWVLIRIWESDTVRALTRRTPVKENSHGRKPEGD